jgi:lysophospholipase L1-like esterase
VVTNVRPTGGGFLTEDKKAAANGLATLDGTSLIPVAQIPTTALQTLNDGRYAPGTVPSGLVGNIKRYEPKSNIYNFHASNTLRLRAQLAKAQAGIDYCRIALVGDSTTAGYRALPTAAQTFPVVLRKALSAAGFAVAGTGPVIANPDGVAGIVIDGRWSFAGGTWTSQSNNMNHLKQAPALNAVATFTSDTLGTVIEIAYLDSGSGFSYSIDGAAYVPVTLTNTSNILTTVVTVATNSTHTVALKAAGTSFWAIWVDVRTPTSGVLIGNFGLDGAQTSDWNNTATTYAPGPVVKAWAPHCTFINLSINDAGGAVSVASYTAALQGEITRAKTTGDVILVNAVPTNGVDKTAYRQAQYSLADTNDVPLLDLDDRWGHGYEPMNTYGMFYPADSAHPSASGYADIALAHIPFFTASAASTAMASGRIRKGTNTGYTSTATLVNDTDLQIPVGANQIWKFDASLYYGGAQGGDLRLAVAIPAGATVRWAIQGYDPAITGVVGTATMRSSSTGGAGGYLNAGCNDSDAVVRLTATVHTGATPGIVAIMNSQDTSNPSTTTVYLDSTLDYAQLS